MRDDVLSLLAARKGHFLLESGHHGDLWLDLELLCLRPRLVQPAWGLDAACGTLFTLWGRPSPFVVCLGGPAAREIS